MLALLRVALLLPSPTLRAVVRVMPGRDGKAGSIDRTGKLSWGDASGPVPRHPRPAFSQPSGCIFAPARRCILSPALTVARAPAERQVPGTRKLTLQGGQRTAYLGHGQPELRVPAARDDVDDRTSRCRRSIARCWDPRAAASETVEGPDYNDSKNQVSVLRPGGNARSVSKVSDLPD